MYPDFKELLSTLNAHKVKYLVVGGLCSGSTHNRARRKTLIFFIGPDEQNAKAVYDALARFGAPFRGFDPADLLDPDGFFRMGHAPLMIEILPVIKGVEFDDAGRDALKIVVDVRPA